MLAGGSVCAIWFQCSKAASSACLWLIPQPAGELWRAFYALRFELPHGDVNVLTMTCWAAQSLDLEDSAAESASDYSGVGDAHFYEVTIGSVDQPKLLSRLTDALVGPAGLACYQTVLSFGKRSAPDQHFTGEVLDMCSACFLACRGIWTSTSAKPMPSPPPTNSP